jgi:hypothetical protein
MLNVKSFSAATNEPNLLAPVDMLPRMLHEFSEVQRHVLARVATHTMQYEGKIPFIPPTSVQKDIALSLVDVRLLKLTSHQPAFQLSRLGLLVAHRLFRIVPVRWLVEQERGFEFMRALMTNHWETH